MALLATGTALSVGSEAPRSLQRSCVVIHHGNGIWFHLISGGTEVWQCDANIIPGGVRGLCESERWVRKATVQQHEQLIKRATRLIGRHGEWHVDGQVVRSKKGRLAGTAEQQCPSRLDLNTTVPVYSGTRTRIMRLP